MKRTYCSGQGITSQFDAVYCFNTAQNNGDQSQHANFKVTLSSGPSISYSMVPPFRSVINILYINIPAVSF
jgi:hypothetical protein